MAYWEISEGVAPCATKPLNLSTSGQSALTYHAKEIKLGELDIKRKPSSNTKVSDDNH